MPPTLSPLPHPSGQTKGTRKDPTFLRAVSQCKSECQLKHPEYDPGDCLAKCQDITCTTYEQCTFKMPRQ